MLNTGEETFEIFKSLKVIASSYKYPLKVVNILKNYSINNRTCLELLVNEVEFLTV